MSYTQVDEPRAEWIAWQLEEAGHVVKIQAWDFTPGSDWVHEMHDAAATTDCTVAVLSSAYLQSEFGEAEWRVAFARDSNGRQRRLIPVRVEDCDPRGLLKTRTYLDLVGLEEDAAREQLLAAVEGRRKKPTSSPAYGGPRAQVRFGVPLLSTFFRGREDEITALDAAASAGERIVVTQAIAGLGGVGKTQLATAYAHRHAHEFDIVAWIRAEDDGVQDLARLAVLLGASTDDRPPAESAEAAVRWLETCEPRWLLILDNLTSPAQLPACCPRFGNGQVLITSRHRELGEYAKVVEIDVFDEGTAASYLLARASKSGTEADARALARALGGLPLALAHAGAYCAPGAPFAEYLDQFNRLTTASMYADRSHEATVATTWQLSVAAANDEAPEAAFVLALAAHYGPDHIPVDLLGDVDDPRAMRPIRLALNALSRYSLITTDGASFSVHRLLQRVVREATDDVETAELALRVLLARFPEEPRPPDAWSRCEALLPHVLALLEHSGGSLPTAPLFTLLRQALGYLLAAGSHARFVALAQAAHAIATARDEVNAGTAFLAEIAHGYWVTGRLDEAIKIEEGLVATTEPDTEAHLVARSNLAASYLSARRFEEAIAIQEAVLAARERLSSPDDPSVALERNNLAASYSRVGRHDDAIRLQLQVVEDCERLLGPSHDRTLRAKSNLASTYIHRGDHTGAVELHTQVLETRVAVFGPEHEDTLASLVNLGYTLFVVGMAAEAIELTERAVTVATASLGAQHPTAVTARNNLHQYRVEVGAGPEAGAD